MFAKDYHLLNEIYSRNVITEDTVDYNAVDAQGAGNFGGDHRQMVKGYQPPIRDCGCGCGGTCGNENPDEDCETCNEVMGDENCEACEGEMGMEEHDNANMAKQSLFRLVKLSAMLHDLIDHESQNIEPWVLAKITEAQRDIEAVYGHQDYQAFKNKVETDIESIEEDTEHDLYNSISSGGSSLLSVIRRLLATESKDVLEGVLYETITALESKQ